MLFLHYYTKQHNTRQLRTLDNIPYYNSIQSILYYYIEGTKPTAAAFNDNECKIITTLWRNGQEIALDSWTEYEKNQFNSEMQNFLTLIYKLPERMS